jgi:hypothetical protein
VGKNSFRIKHRPTNTGGKVDTLYIRHAPKKVNTGPRRELIEREMRRKGMK